MRWSVGQLDEKEGKGGTVLLCQGWGIISSSYGARGGKSPLSEEYLLGEYVLWGSSVAVLSSSVYNIMLKGPGGRGGEGTVCKTYLDTIMCKERLCICLCSQLKAGDFAPVLIFPHQQSKRSLLTVVVAFAKQICQMKET